MPAVQTAYNERQPHAVAGMVANMRNWDAITRTCEEADGIGFGLAVGRGDDDAATKAKLGGTLPDFLGVSKRDITIDAESATDEYAENQNMGILTEGEIWVQVSGTPGPDDPVHFNATTGVFAGSGGSGPVVGARWMEVSANGLGRLHLSRNQAAA